MKTKLLLLMLCISCIGFAQNGINYKALIKDDLGNIVADQSVKVRFTILEEAITVYQETHLPVTDANGIVIVNIGEGTPTAGTFNAMDWTAGDHFLQVEIDIAGGNDFIDMGTTQFKSVPYAIAADNIQLPYFDRETTDGGSGNAAFHVHNDNTNATYGVVGSTGGDGANIPANRAGVLGYSTLAHGVYGRSENSFYAGVQGVSNSAEGVGVQGYGFGGGVGGHFYTTSTGTAALTTGTGNVGIGIDEPERRLHVGGDLFVQTNLGSMLLGFPNNGNQWAINTIGSGANLQFRSKADGSNARITRFRMLQGGEFQLGATLTPSAWMHIRGNSTISKPQLKLEEDGNDFARLEFTNTTSSGDYWQIAGLPSSTSSNARLNFYFRNDSEIKIGMSHMVLDFVFIMEGV